MRGALAVPIMRPMTSPRHLRVVIDLTVDRSDICGVVTDENGASTSFTGLLGLFAALETARDRPARGADPDRRR
jgi:hypothetical protein